MIAVKIEGRLGNQMFQYAFIYSAAKRLNTSFYIDKGIEKFKLYDYFDIEKDRFYLFDKCLFTIQGFKNIFSYHLREWFYNRMHSLLFNKQIVFGNDKITATEELRTLMDNQFYYGYYQSEKYFIDNIEKVKSLFTIKKDIAEAYRNSQLSLTANKTIVTVHIRRTDYKGLERLNLGGADLSLPYSYYHKAIERFDKEDYFFIFITDDKSGIVSEFSYLQNKYVSQSDEITDFQHMLNADICIIANSTFSWWAAYLNNKPNKVVIAPKYFLGWRIKKQVPIEIYPDNWNLIEFE